MANLKEVRNRIVSVSSTQQITKAMKMVSAAKLRRAQDAIQQLRPYASKLREILQNLSQSLGSEGGEYAKVRPVEKVLLIVITSNRGLCGAFNSNVIRLVRNRIRGQYSEQEKQGNVKILCIGKKASDYFSKEKNSYLGHHNELYANLKFEDVAKIAETIMSDFSEEKYDRVEIVYNQFKNAATQLLTLEQMLPLEPEASDEKLKKNIPDYIFEPNQQEIVKDLIPKSLKTQLFKAILDSVASEHGARMTSMNKATDNAADLIKDLKLSYNKARQAAITGEILEIVGGAEALKG